MSLSVLVIDDMDYVHDNIRPLLHHFHCDPIYSARTGEDGLRIFIEANPSLILLDIDLAGALDGLEVLRWMLYGKPASFITMLSGDTRAATVQKVLKLGARSFIGKPFSEISLSRVLKQYLKVRKNLDALSAKTDPSEQVQRMDEVKHVVSAAIALNNNRHKKRAGSSSASEQADTEQKTRKSPALKFEEIIDIPTRICLMLQAYTGLSPDVSLLFKPADLTGKKLLIRTSGFIGLKQNHALDISKTCPPAILQQIQEALATEGDTFSLKKSQVHQTLTHYGLSVKYGLQPDYVRRRYHTICGWLPPALDLSLNISNDQKIIDQAARKAIRKELDANSSDLVNRFLDEPKIAGHWKRHG